MGNYLRSFRISILFIVLLFSSLELLSQTIYSDNALTGRGDLHVVGVTYKLQKEVQIAFERMQEEALRRDVPGMVEYCIIFSIVF